MSTQPSQAKTIRLQLLLDMKEGIYANCERLPRESVLSEKLGISRTQLRDILASLEREGFITRRHGVGTIINRHVLEATARMDIEVEFLDMIRQSGYQAEVAYVRVSDGVADAKIAGQLNMEEGDPIIRVARLCTADGRPAIYCEDVVEKALARGDYTIQDFKLPIFHFLQRFCGIYLTFIGSALTVRVDGHVSVDILISFMKDNKSRAVLFIIGRLICVIFLIMFFPGAMTLVSKSFNSLGAAIRIPYAYIYAAAPLGIIMMLCAYASAIPQLAKEYREGKR